MSVILDKQALENIKNYKYRTNGLTLIERVFLDPFWNFVCNHSPDVIGFDLRFSHLRQT